MPAELFFVGEAAGLNDALRQVARDYGVEREVHVSTEFVSTDCYRDLLIASDAAIQLRTYGFGQPSAALADCISAALPAVAGEELAASCDAPSYVSRVPDHISPLLIAEKLAEIWDRRWDRPAFSAERLHYCELHSFERYARGLTEILGFG